ncbi:glycosyltransferase family 4 protein [Cypionkella sp.]|uniref:glycosyltransferase family 4 protein n=1 Tax=Cypionkella sp. TaxID=2811411 RepID=UPI003751DEC7
MKILILGSFRSSLYNFRGPLIISLIEAGCEVHVCAPGLKHDSDIKSWLILNGVLTHDIDVSRHGLNPFSDIKYLILLCRLMTNIRPDVFLGYTIKPVIWGLYASWFTKIPNRFGLVTGLGYAFTNNHSVKHTVIFKIVCWLYHNAIKRASLIFFQNVDDREYLKKIGILTTNSRSIILNGSGVDLSRFLPTEFPEGNIQFLMIARLLNDKGLREYAKAAKHILEIHPNVSFHLVGGGDSNPEAIPISEVRAWSDAGSIKWHGELLDVRPSIRACHVYVLPSYREGTPRTVLEAMAMGRPIITTDAPGCRETIVDGESGFLVPVKDSDALVSAMVRFIENPALVSAMGAKARLRAVKKYDVNLVNAVMLKALGVNTGTGSAPE